MPELQELLTENLRDLLDAEKQLTKALPKMAKAAKSQELKQAFLDHTEMTKGQVTRLEQVFEALGERAKSKPCKAMKGLVEEAQEHVTEHEKGDLLDQMLIGAAQKVEHYEIAAYGTARAIAKSMRSKDAMELLQQTLKEEETTDKLLTTVALGLQKQMLEAEGETDPRGGASQSSRGGSKKKVRGA
jgi:ferritin-like metal-binding protein YciE